MNLLGLAYLPIFFFDLRLVLFGGRLVQSVVHVCMFAVVVKLFALQRPRDVWQTFGAIFFVFLAAIATSVHPSIVLYLLVFSGLALALLARLAMLQVLPSYGTAGPSPEQIPLRGFIFSILVLSVLLAAPLFFLFPRVNSPFMGIRGTGTGTELFSTGFSDEVTLDSIGRQRDNPDVALRLRYAGSPPGEDSIRLKGGTFDLYRGKRWRASQHVGEVIQGDAGQFHLAEQPLADWVEVWMQPMPSRAVLLPVETVRVELEASTVLALDAGGAVSLLRRPNSGLTYRAGVTGRPFSLALDLAARKKKKGGQEAVREALERAALEDRLAESRPAESQSSEGQAQEEQASSGDDSGRGPAMDHRGLSERSRALARRIMGEDGPDRERVQLLTRYLAENFTYSLEFMGRTGDDPLEEFLFETRRGHCELFASSTVLLLRSPGIPARLVTGFLGAEYNPLTGYFIVRQSNAHAWVEAYLEGEEWQIFDPTPAAGLPGSSLRRGSLLQQMADFVMFRWDRYVLTYGMEDQVSVLERLARAWRSLREWFEVRRGNVDDFDELTEVGTLTAETGDTERTLPVEEPGAWYETLLGSLLALMILLALALTYLDRRRRHTTATEAFRRLRKQLDRKGLQLTDSTAPLVLKQRTAEEFPEASEPAGKIIDFYLRESFGGYTLESEEREEILLRLKEIREVLDRRKAS